MNCPKCKSILPDDSRFCQFCGADVTITAAIEKERQHYCKSCKEIIFEDSAYCPFCGEKISNSITCNSIPEYNGEFVKTGVKKREKKPDRRGNTVKVFVILGIVLVILIVLAVAIFAVLNSPPVNRALINL